MDWKFKKNAKPQGSSDGFWYDLTMGGYICPGELLADPAQIKSVTDAVALLESFEDALREADLLNEF